MSASASSRWLARLRAEFGALRCRTGRDLQLRLDTARLYLLSSSPSIPTPPPLDLKALQLQHDLPPFDEQLAAVSSRLSQQAADFILDADAGTLGGAGDAASDSAPASAAPQPPPAAIPAFSAAYTPGSSSRRPRTRRPRGFSLSVATSSIPSAGQGLFVAGLVPAGTLVSLYPGVTYRPSEVRNMADYPSVSKNNEYLMWRYDGIIVDGSPASVDRVRSRHAASAAPSEPLLRRYAAGQFANHPAPGARPNALQYAVALDLRRLGLKQRALVPNLPWRETLDAGGGEGGEEGGENGGGETSYEEKEVAARAKLAQGGGFVARTLKNLEDMVIRQRVAGTADIVPAGGIPADVAVHGLGIVALRDLEDEEVFINYRFNPASPLLPDWYQACDAEESGRRWVQEGFWN